MLCIFSFGRKFGAFFWLFFLSSHTLHSQLYIKSGTDFAIKENTIVYNAEDSSVILSPKLTKEKTAVYAKNGVLVSGFQEHSNAEVLYISTKSTVKNKKQKIADNNPV